MQHRYGMMGRVSSDPDVEAVSTTAPPRRVGVFVLVAAIVLALDVVSKILVVANLSVSGYTRRAGRRDLPRRRAQLRRRVLPRHRVHRHPHRRRDRGRGRDRARREPAALARLGGRARPDPRRRARQPQSTGSSARPASLRGHVVDWISLFGPYGAHWPIFNLADSAIVCGAILAAVLSLFGVDTGRTARGVSESAAPARAGRAGRAAARRRDLAPARVLAHCRRRPDRRRARERRRRARRHAARRCTAAPCSR